MNLHIALASFAGAGVEFLETAVIAYVLAQSGYPREALIGTILGSLLRPRLHRDRVLLAIITAISSRATGWARSR